MSKNFTLRAEKSLAKVFDNFAEPVKIIYTKQQVTTVGQQPVKVSTTLKIDSNYMRGFFTKPTTKDANTAIVEYDGELVIRDLKFDVATVAYSVGTYTTLGLTDTLVINSNTLDVSSVASIDDLIALIGTVKNVFCFKLSSTQFIVISSVADNEIEVGYKDLTIAGTAQTLLQLEALSKKATLSVQVGGILYSAYKVFNGDCLKSLYLKRG